MRWGGTHEVGTYTSGGEVHVRWGYIHVRWGRTCEVGTYM